MTKNKKLINFDLTEIGDGGAWKNEAMNSVATYLEDNFAEEVESKHVVVIS
ncbi:hypothetical protein [Companilactobacillus jidongensis]|uniref:hypothetical protein n=1 Tax=Companilactobacillus jidongensis TaxID=2486006 RepID=UPI0013DDCCB1|nr:hypothetical protein [Companilactobacillus jidongensis]